ncbi:hypothetical protein OH407_23910, partial [Salmonella enterica]|nr:hypothetical protein [Salmonella enterica]
MPMQATNVLRKCAIYASVLIVTAFTIAPFLWVIITSLSTNKEITSIPMQWFPDQPTLKNYMNVLLNDSNVSGYLASLFNSLVVAVV